jgi:glutaredoxin-like protein
MADRLLNESISQQVREAFAQLKHPVEVLFFGRKSDCEYCEATLQLVQEVVALSDKLGLKTYDLDDQPEVARQYRVDKVPALVIAARQDGQIVDYGIRYFGIPAGHEFSSLIHDLILVSGRDSGLSPETRAFLASLKQPVSLEVFVTPT